MKTFPPLLRVHSISRTEKLKGVCLIWFFTSLQKSMLIL